MIITPEMDGQMTRGWSREIHRACHPGTPFGGWLGWLLDELQPFRRLLETLALRAKNLSLLVMGVAIVSLLCLLWSSHLLTFRMYGGIASLEVLYYLAG